jgi:hypothetical protein
MESQLQYLKEVADTVNEFKQQMPQAFAAQTAFTDAVYAGGAWIPRPSG